MAQVLRHLTPATDERLLVDASSGDDAAVWQLDDERALVVTADFITPIVDDARTWGRIAATNAVSDVYAMGGKPFLALNLVAWNREELSNDLLGEVLAGASDVATDGGFIIAGGHTIDDPAPKFGLAVIGEVHPDRMITNRGLRPNQHLILTKPLGTGIAATAIKRGEATSELVQEVVASMVQLNDRAAAVAQGAGATGGTDVTGFGLLGHLGRAAAESGVDVGIDVAAVPTFNGVYQLADEGVVPGGTRRNLASIIDRIDGDATSTAALILADAQTSGGLVFGVDSEHVDAVLASLRADGHLAARIGETTTGSGRIALLDG